MPFPDGTGLEDSLWTGAHERTDAARSGGGSSIQEPAYSGAMPEALRAPTIQEQPRPQYTPQQAAAAEQVAAMLQGKPVQSATMVNTVRQAVALAAEPEPVTRNAIIHTAGSLHLADAVGLPTDEGGNRLFWKVACKTGTLALSPGPGQMDVETPLVLTDSMFSSIKTAFDEKAFPHVTVPETHDNDVLKNTGYVREVLVLDHDDARLPAEIKKAHAADPAGTKLLMTGVEFTQPDVADRAQNGSIPDTSVGVKFGYRNKRTGKTYAAALEHLSLTPVPWVDGLSAFHQGAYLSQRPFDQDEDDLPFDGVYVPVEEINLAMRVRMSGDDWDADKVKTAIGALQSGDEWSWNYGVCVRAMSVAGSDQLGYTLDGGYGLGDTEDRTTFYPGIENLMVGVSTAVARQVAKKAADRLARAVPGAMVESDYYSAHLAVGDKLKCPKCDAMNPASAKKCKSCGHDLAKARGAMYANLSQDPLPEMDDVGELPGELHASIEHHDEDILHMSDTPTAEQILAEQAAEIERLNNALEASNEQIALSQGATTSVVEQLHASQVGEKVRALQDAGYPPALCLAAREIYLGDKSGLTSQGDAGLKLSVTASKTADDGTVSSESAELKSPSAIVDFLLSAVPTGPASEAARMASFHQTAAEMSLAARPGAGDAADQAKAAVEENERRKHPERYEDDGKGKRK